MSNFQELVTEWQAVELLIDRTQDCLQRALDGIERGVPDEVGYEYVRKQLAFGVDALDKALFRADNLRLRMIDHWRALELARTDHKATQR